MCYLDTCWLRGVSMNRCYYVIMYYVYGIYTVRYTHTAQQNTDFERRDSIDRVTVSFFY